MKEQDIMEEWAQGYVGLPDWDRRVGRWRPLRTLIDPGKRFEKAEGVLVLNAAQWDLYFYLDDNFNHNIMCGRLMQHPFTNSCSVEPLKQKGSLLTNPNTSNRDLSQQIPTHLTEITQPPFPTEPTKPTNQQIEQRSQLTNSKKSNKDLN